MKTKHLFTAMCLPAVFAACTAEDLTSQAPQLMNRETIDLKLAAENLVWNDLDTRMDAGASGNKISYTWTSSDVIGAAMADGSQMGTLNGDNKVWNNVPFTTEGTTEEGAQFTTQSQVMKGKYYFYYQFNKSTDRETMTLEIPAEQSYVKGDGKVSAYSQMAKYLTGISPIFDLTANGIVYDNSLELPISFVKLASPLIVKFKTTNAPEGTKIEKITLKKSSGTIVNGGVVKFAALSNVAKADITDADAVATAKATLLNTVNADDGAVGIYVDQNKTVETLTLTLDDSKENKGLTVTNGTEYAVCLAVPCSGKKVAYVLEIETSEGYYQNTFEVAFASGSAVPMNLQEMRFGDQGNMKQREAFAISSDTDWANAISYIQKHAGAYLGKTIEFELQKDGIEVSSLPNFPVTISANSNLSNPELIMNKDFSISEINKAERLLTFDSSVGALGVKAGKTVTVDAVPAIEIHNYGTMNISETIILTEKVVNLGTINVDEATTFNDLDNGDENDVAAEININKTLAIAASATVANKPSATITIAETDGVLTGAGITAFTNEGTIVNNGTFSVAGTITNAADALIQNNGLQTVIMTNNGTIEIGADSKSDNSSTITNNALIKVADVAKFSALSAKAYNITNVGYGRTTVVVTTKAGYDVANAASLGINHITLQGGAWKMAQSAATGVIAEPVSDISAGITLDGAKLDVSEALNSAIASVIVVNASELSTTSVVAVTVKIDKLTLEKGSSFTVSNNVQVNEAASANNATAKISGTLTLTAGVSIPSVLAPTKMYFNTVEIDADGKLVGAEDAEFGVKEGGTFTNEGSITVSGGKVSWPTAGDGTMKGQGNNTIGEGWS